MLGFCQAEQVSVSESSLVSFSFNSFANAFFLSFCLNFFAIFLLVLSKWFMDMLVLCNRVLLVGSMIWVVLVGVKEKVVVGFRVGMLV